MSIRFKTQKIIDCADWDKLVEETYKKPYKFQQQDGCQDRGLVRFDVPDEDDDAEQHDSIPELVNGNKRGVKFATWLARDPAQPLNGEQDPSAEWVVNLWWYRNFYPDLQTLANDLHKKGLLEAGEYAINIDW